MNFIDRFILTYMMFLVESYEPSTYDIIFLMVTSFVLAFVWTWASKMYYAYRRGQYE